MYKDKYIKITIFKMKKIVKIGTVDEQDDWRRMDCSKMKGSERVLAMAERMNTWNNN